MGGKIVSIIFHIWLIGVIHDKSNPYWEESVSDVKFILTPCIVIPWEVCTSSIDLRAREYVPVIGTAADSMTSPPLLVR